MQFGHAHDSLGTPSANQAAAGFIHHLHIVIRLGPIIPHEQHSSPSPCRQPTGESRRPNGSVLTGTTSHQPSVLPTHRQGHGLDLGLTPRPTRSSAHPPAAEDTTLPHLPTGRCNPISSFNASGAPAGPLPPGPLQDKLADATGYPLPAPLVLRQANTPRVPLACHYHRSTTVNSGAL
jgi:hypothetical protein